MQCDQRDDALLRKVGDLVATFPDNYCQSEFIEETQCGTVACVAGYAHMLADCCPQTALGLDDDELFIFHPDWLPSANLPGDTLAERVKSALYALADGADIIEVTHPPSAGSELESRWARVLADRLARPFGPEVFIGAY